jgi:hypothetical protein
MAGQRILDPLIGVRIPAPEPKSGALLGHSAPAGDPLDLLTRSLDRATEAGQWEVAKAIIRQIERLELERAGNVTPIDAKRTRK